MTANAPDQLIPGAKDASFSGRGFQLGLYWENLSYKVGDKEILSGLSGAAAPGRIVAIMGSSGSGKTVFLNALSDRLMEDEKHTLSGKRKLNSVDYTSRYQKLVALVAQEDVVSAMATPNDALSFSLRIRRGTTPEVTAAKVDELLTELGLQQQRHTIVGIQGIVAGLSGGERKRTNIGVELIADPKVLLLDEPTSGLDSFTARRIVALCRDVAQRGRTVMFSIHQPTADCVALFDDLLLLCRGRVVYHGPMADATDYFESIGYPCPITHTPTDYFISLVEDAEKSTDLIDKWSSMVDLSAPPPKIKAMFDDCVAAIPHEESVQYLEDYIKNTGSSLGIQASELMKREVTNVLRNKQMIIGLFVQSLFFGLITGLIFVNLKEDVQGIQDRMGLLFMVTANRCFGGVMLQINAFPRDKAVFMREQKSGSYSPTFYLLSKILAELPFQAISALLETIIIYFITGLVLEAGRFFHYFAVVFMVTQSAAGLGLVISASVESYVLATALAPFCVLPMLLSGGLLASTSRIRPYWIWLEKLSIVRYAFVLLAKNEFTGLDHITCDPAKFEDVNGTAFCMRQPRNGYEVLENYELTGTSHADWLMWTCLAAWFVVMRVLCTLALNRVGKSKV